MPLSLITASSYLDAKGTVAGNG